MLGKPLESDQPLPGPRPPTILADREVVGTEASAHVGVLPLLLRDRAPLRVIVVDDDRDSLLGEHPLFEKGRLLHRLAFEAFYHLQRAPCRAASCMISRLCCALIRLPVSRHRCHELNQRRM